MADNAERRFLTAIRRAAQGELSTVALGEYLKDLDAARAALESAGGPCAHTGSVEEWEAMNAEARRAFLVENVRTVTVKDDGVAVAV